MFAREHNVSQGTTNAFQENANFLGGMKTFCEQMQSFSEEHIFLPVNAKTLKNRFCSHLHVPLWAPYFSDILMAVKPLLPHN